MSINEKTTAKVAHLAKLELNDADLKRYTEDLGNILDMVMIMQQVDTGDVEPMSHPSLTMVARQRNDQVLETNQRELMQLIAPETEKGFYLVPKVIE